MGIHFFSDSLLELPLLYPRQLPPLHTLDFRRRGLQLHGERLQHAVPSVVRSPPLLS